MKFPNETNQPRGETLGKPQEKNGITYTSPATQAKKKANTHMNK